MGNISNKDTKKKKLIPIIIIAGIAIAILILILASGGNNNSGNSNDNSYSNTINSSDDNSENLDEGSENITNDNAADNSSDVVPLNSYANIAEKVEMKVNNTYVEDEVIFAIRVTFKNNGNNDVVLSTSSWDKNQIAYYEAYFVPKSIGIANATNEDLILEPCLLRKIVQNDGTEITLTSGDREDTFLKPGEILDGIITCSITRVEGKANGVEPILMEVEHIPDSNQEKVTLFNLTN